MPPKPNNLSSLSRSATRLRNIFASASDSVSTATSTSTSPAAPAYDFALYQFAASIDVSKSGTVQQRLRNSKSPQPKSGSSSHSKPSGDVSLADLKLQSSAESEESPRELLAEISSILNDGSNVHKGDSHDSNDNVSPVGEFLNIPWLLSKPYSMMNIHRKEISRERKQRWIFKSGQKGLSGLLMDLCEKLGADSTKQILDKCSAETGPEDLGALVKCCIQTARETDDPEVSSKQIVEVYKILESMKERGFQIKEEIYGPVLMYLIRCGMVTEFHLFHDLVKGEALCQRLAYYEMLLWIKLNNEDRIQELCYDLSLYDGEDKSSFQENYLLAFCESGRRSEVLRLLKTFDITKVSSDEGVLSIFRSLGKLLLESVAESCLVALKLNDVGPYRISYFIYTFVTSIPNLVVEDVIFKCRSLHRNLDVKPSSRHYEKLIQLSCNSFQVHAALDILDEMLEAGHELSLKTYNFILDSCAETCEYHLVRRIFSMLSLQGLQPSAETFRIMINVGVKMKDFEGAYHMISDLEKMNLKPTAGMYNAIMAGFFREKKLQAAVSVLKQMEDARVKPDSQTYSCLLSNCSSVEDINEISDAMKFSGVQPTKHIHMALINAHAACGEFDKAKQVILDENLPVKNLNEIKSVLVSALASNGQMSDALDVYEEIKQAKFNLEPKAVICLIENLSNGDLSRLLQLLEELRDPGYWLDGCFRVISHCVHHGRLRPAVDLLKQLKDKTKMDEVTAENIFDGVFCQFAEKDSPEMLFGMNLLQAIKEELGVRPSRKSLDFLLTACLNAKDLSTCFLVWKEYQAAGLPYNVMSFVRMYQVLLALGDYKSAAKIRSKIPKDDPHVSYVVDACDKVYKTAGPMDKNKEEKKKKKVKGKLSSNQIVRDLVCNE